MRKERVATREANAKAKAKTVKRRRTSSASGSTRAPSTPDHWYGSDGCPSDEDDEEQEHNTTTRTEAANDMATAEQRAELEEYLNRGVQAKVDRLMADIDARRGRK